MVVGRGNDAIPTWSGFNYQGKMMLLYVLELINQIAKDKNKDIDRRLEETTKQLQREREKLMAVIRMSGDLIFEYDIAKDQMHYAGPEEGSM